MLGKFSRPVITAAIGLASAAAVAVGGSTVHAAPQLPAPPAMPELPRANPGGTNTLPLQVPFDNELATALRFLKQAGGDKIVVELLQAIIGAAGQISPVSATTADQPVPGIKAVDPAGDPLILLRQAGVQPLTPSVAPMCTTPTPQNPLGLVHAASGAIPGPWPLKTGDPLEPLRQLPFPLPGITIPDPNIVKDKQTAFAFVPADARVGQKSGTMRVAWFNLGTMRGGVNELTPITETNPLLKVLPALSGVRLVPVDTGKGTILAAVYGTSGANGNRECFFLPSVGVVNS
ncbi:hypothetical protein GOARA_061_00430 [Gordonia araii NBRC 100433]|uniref:Secreted protein n=1 Tax=Gordonia araii NBRC 100433 TaxID=1073574 RepID=G7H429_9ACTN|nr:hypothetical protein [Gordonia araii]NNG96331.1 hypothetical protein [Gordonia araii NBRC 100433]GAB10604.1 hypothetical protein GOARA_061_00430 [Gordonia araii NBRC 100433]